jgi:ketosteroid isomerase-like protein
MREATDMDEHPNATVVRGAFDAFAADDLAALGAVFTDDVVWHVPGMHRFAGRFEGRASVLERLERMREAGIEQTLEVHDVVANDEHAVALVRLRVAGPDGRRYDQQQVQVWHMRDGRCHEYWAMNEDQAVLDVLLS